MDRCRDAAWHSACLSPSSTDNALTTLSRTLSPFLPRRDTCPDSPGCLKLSVGTRKLLQILMVQKNLLKAMKEWWSPLEKAKNLGDNPTYTAEIRDGPLKYFANIAYEQTTKIGCAVETCTKQGRLVIDCRYNTLISDDEVIYTTGKVCSKCRDTADTTQCSALGGLCVKPP
ncbi:hypothetical protein Y032_0574g176 [Ancylostoma ceylanicum]|uniref:SCP domain-containing protein n=2 Tax=Ancylostoma ceylanicum TaxID=53326 RepID=A0A016WPS4_9BILA|nr:hypothetical protein Y032_0574g176 [Ancylostoma ceylanicum]